MVVLGPLTHYTTGSPFYILGNNIHYLTNQLN